MKRIVTFSIVFALLLHLAACSRTRTAISADEFITKMTEAGFEIFDVTEKHKDEYGEELIHVVLDAEYGNFGECQFIYASVPSNMQAKTAFYENRQTIENIDSLGHFQSSSSYSGSNFDVFNRSVNGTYHVVTRIDNTFIYIFADSDYKKFVNSILDDLGY